jgi:phosphatidate cytidylyltransferase
VLVARLATTIVGVPLVLAAVWLGGLPFWILGALAAFLAAREAAGLLGLPLRSYPASLAIAGAMGLVAGAAGGPTGLVAVLAVVFATLFLGILQPPRAEPTASTAWSRGLAACLYAGLPLALLVLMRGWAGAERRLELLGVPIPLPPGVAWVLATLTTTWAVDTVAYAIGRAFGRRPFSPRLSARKTWEGTVAGFAAGCAVFLAWTPLLDLWWPPALLVGAVASGGAIAGDLAESALKRAASAKDAGHLLPGHGGLLDRIDSLAISTIVVFLSGVLAMTGGSPR